MERITNIVSSITSKCPVTNIGMIIGTLIISALVISIFLAYRRWNRTTSPSSPPKSIMKRQEVEPVVSDSSDETDRPEPAQPQFTLSPDNLACPECGSPTVLASHDNTVWACMQCQRKYECPDCFVES